MCANSLTLYHEQVAEVLKYLVCIGNNCQINYCIEDTRKLGNYVHVFGDYPAYMFVTDDVFCEIIEICKTKPTEANYLLFTFYN